MLFAGLPLLACLACSAAPEKIELADLQYTETASENDNPGASDVPQTREIMPETVYVHICGEVISPGVYQVESDSRIYDVLLLAGGFTEGAAQEAVNLAGPVVDGMQVIIPSEEELLQEKEVLAKQRAGMVNINTATAEELCTLPGVGESRAQDIIAYRTKHGLFDTVEEIMQVPGIKEGLYEKIQNKIYIE